MTKMAESTHELAEMIAESLFFHRDKLANRLVVEMQEGEHSGCAGWSLKCAAAVVEQVLMQQVFTQADMPKLRKLNWHRQRDDDGKSCLSALVPIGCFRVYKTRWTFGDPICSVPYFSGPCDNETDGQAKAMKWLEETIPHFFEGTTDGK